MSAVLRILTLNLGRAVDWPARRSRLVRRLGQLAPDVLTLQGVVRDDGVDQAREVLPAEYHVAHQTARGDDGSGVTTASRWPIGMVQELDLQFARDTEVPCTTLVTEILAPVPWGRVWLANHLPSWQPRLEHQRELQAVVAARALERLAAERPGHVVVAGNLDADPDSTSIRFWTGRHAVDGWSVCYRDAWESARPAEPGHTFAPDNPYVTDWDWPFRRIDYVLVRCADQGGPTLAVRDCRRVLDGDDVVSDHYGVLAELEIPSPFSTSSRERAGR
jgi:endonuclease/exonuclease/phosphatase family metal-dependent hydrolase